MKKSSNFSIFGEDPIFLLRGGIGNQLFIYSAAIRLGQIHAFTPEFQTLGIDHKECISELGIPGNFMSTKNSWLYSLDRRMNQFLSKRRVKDFSDLAAIHMKNLTIGKKTYVSGYFQTAAFAVDLKNSGFFDDYISKEPTIFLKREYEEIRDLNSTIIHLRFGDYLKASSTLGNLTVDYYNQIFDSDPEIGENPVYLMTDDPSSAKLFVRDFPKLNLVFLDKFRDVKAIEQIKLFGAANRIICANSTYSWWGAFLSNRAKKIWVPNPWFKDPKLAAHADGIYPPTFVQFPSSWK